MERRPEAYRSALTGKMRQQQKEPLMLNAYELTRIDD
jgi:hypothetical protein